MPTAPRMQRIRAPAMLLLRAVAAFLCLLALPPRASAADPGPDLQRVTRSGFSMDMPAWTVEVDQDNGADGRHVRVAHTLRAEVAWTLDGQAEAADLDPAIEALQPSYQATRVARRVERPPGQLRLYSLLEMEIGAWMAITQVACRDAGVLATVFLMAPERAQAEALHARMLASFACRDAKLPKLVGAWPASDLPEDFGVFMEGSPVLAHRDGRWAMIGKLAPGTIASIAADAARARQAFAVYSEALGADWTVATAATEIRNLSGPALAWTLESPVLGTVAASAFTCADGASGYVLFAGDDSGAADATALRALSARFGCPDLPLPSVLARASACDVGVAGFCEPEGP